MRMLGACVELRLLAGAGLWMYWMRCLRRDIIPIAVCGDNFNFKSIGVSSTDRNEDPSQTNIGMELFKRVSSNFAYEDHL